MRSATSHLSSVKLNVRRKTGVCAHFETFWKVKWPNIRIYFCCKLTLIGEEWRSVTFFKRAILPNFPADMTGEEQQNVDTVIIFTRLHIHLRWIALNLILIVIIIESKFKFEVLSNPERATSEGRKGRMRLRSRRLPTPGRGTILPINDKCLLLLL